MKKLLIILLLLIMLPVNASSIVMDIDTNRILYEDNKKYLYVSNNSLLEKGVAKQLKACDIDICDVSGMIPLVMVICSFSNGSHNI